MPGPCSPEFDRLAGWLGGFGCETAEPVVQLRAPWALTSWSLVAVELLMVAGAAYALVRGLRRWRRARDPMPLALWVASVVYLLLLEPTVYFPEELGVPGQHEIIFVHNVFMVQLMYDRLPLYVVALYPAMLTLAYETVRALDVFGRRGPVVGALCVGAVHHGFYEVFDHLGPQLRWWVWAPDARSNHLMLGSVPLTSSALFATIAPVLLVLLVRRLLGVREGSATPRGTASMLARSSGAGALMLPVLGIVGAPWIPAVAWADPSVGPSLAVGFGLVPLAMTAWMVVDAWRTAPRPPDAGVGTYVEVHGAVFLAVFLVLWTITLPDYLDASNGTTLDGTAVGSLPYAFACFVASAALLFTVARSARSAQRRRDGASAARTSSEPPTTPARPLQVRRIDFDFEGVPFQWHPELPHFGLLMNTVGIIAIAFEKYLVSAVRMAMPRITDPAVAEEADAFVRQEGLHAAAHRRHIRALTRSAPGLAKVLDHAVARFDELLATQPLEFHLAYIADLEATFTPVFKLWLDHHEESFRGGDERVASLFLWHFVEEVEHRSSALILYDHLVRSPWYRARMAPAVMRHTAAVYTQIVEDLERHVPKEQRMADTRDLLASGIWRRELSLKLPRRVGGRSGERGGMFPGASIGEVLGTLYRLVLSQAPNHDPAHQPLPSFADDWMAGYDRGQDVTHWYSSRAAE